LELKPIGGMAWAPARRPRRMHATYRRLKGTEQLWASPVSPPTVSAACPAAASACPTSSTPSGVSELAILIAGGSSSLTTCSTHDHPRFLALLRRLHIQPVWTPIEASWLNLIEAQFGVLKRFTLANTDDADHVPRRRRIYRYLQRLGRLQHPLNRIRSIRPVNLERH
jgi:hypothetical protein